MAGKRYGRSMAPGQVASDALRDIREELELYLELRTEELVESGMDPIEARRVAEEHFGDAARIEDELRRQARRRRAKRGTVMTMGGLKQDVRFALRTLRRNPGFAFVAVLTLGLALGGNTAIFSVVDAALLQAMPFEDADELVFVNGSHRTDGEVAIRGASFPEFYDWQDRARTIEPMAAVGTFTLAVSGDGEAEPLAVEMVTEEYFAVLRAEAALGRTFTAEEHGPGGTPGLAVLSDGLWERRYGHDTSALGSTVVLDDQPYSVIGVMPPSFGGTALNTDVWIAESSVSLIGFEGLTDARTARFLSVVGRLHGPEEGAQEELDAIAAELQRLYPAEHEDRFAQIQGFREAYLDTTGQLLWVLLGAGALLLAIGAANVANLLLVRAHGRTREIVLRRALGAETHRVAGQLLTESVVLAAAGGVLGLFLAWVGLRTLAPMIPQGVLPGYVDVALSAKTFLFSAATLAVVGLFMGLVPAMASARVQLATTLREGGLSAAGSLKRLRAQHLFVIAQVALALVLMVGAGLLTRSFRAQVGVDTGASISDVVAMRVSLPDVRYPDAEARREFGDEAHRLAETLPGVENASVSSDLPFRGGSVGSYVYAQSAPEDRIRYHRHSVGPEYLETVGIELSAGRFISETDVADGPGVAVITEAMAARVFPDENPVGQTMYMRPGADPDFAFEVVGVIRDLRYRDLTTSLMAERNSPDIFFAFSQIPTSTIEIAVKVQGEPESFVPALRALAAELDPDLPVFDVAPVVEGYRAQTATPRFAAFLMSLLSGLAALLACVGIYGILSFAVGQRGREIAVRLAIGASAPSVARSVIGDGMKLVSIGLGVGALVALTGSRALEHLLFEVTRTDPITFVSVAGLMLAVAAVAALIPAVRATRKDPAAVLGAE